MKYAECFEDFSLAFETEPLYDDELDQFYYRDTMPIRMNHENKSPIKNIFKSCILQKRHNAHLLLGHRGCGKSTELNELKRNFEWRGHCVSIVQCTVEADILGLSYYDLLILLGKHLCFIAEEAGCALPDSLISDMDNYWKEVVKIDVIKEKHRLGIKSGVTASTPKMLPIINIFAQLTSEIKFGHDKKIEIRDYVKKSTVQWIRMMVEASDYIASNFNGKQPIVIFEDLDKLSQEKAWEVFSEPLSQMPFPVIYTFPISLSYAPRFAHIEASFNNNVHILPMIKIRTPEGDRYNEGISAIKGIIKKRANLALFNEDALDYLIDKTGGMLRDLFYCITMAADLAEASGSNTITLYDAQSAIKQISNLLTRRIEVKNYPLLRNIYKGEKFRNQIDDREMLLDMMQGLVVLEYNGDRWHDLHPLIEDFLKKQGELD